MPADEPKIKQRLLMRKAIQWQSASNHDLRQVRMLLSFENTFHFLPRTALLIRGVVRALNAIRMIATPFRCVSHWEYSRMIRTGPAAARPLPHYAIAYWP